MKTTKSKASKPAPAADVQGYADGLSPGFAGVGRLLHAEINAGLKNATAKIWHAMPVWFIDENPVVGYKATDKHVLLLFWNGQAFKEPALIAAGKFQAAQIKYTEQAQVDVPALRRWLKKARTEIWDFRGLLKSRSA